MDQETEFQLNIYAPRKSSNVLRNFTRSSFRIIESFINSLMEVPRYM